MRLAKILVVAIFWILVCGVALGQNNEKKTDSRRTTKWPPGNVVFQGEIVGIGMVPPGGIVMFYGDVSKAFDKNGTGLTDTPYEGWQLCNGYNNTPDLQGRFVLGAGQGGGLTNRTVRDLGGEETHALTVEEMPSHIHEVAVQFYDLAFKNERIQHGLNSYRNYCAGVGVQAKPSKTSPAGQGKAHNNMPPFYVLAFIMRLPTSVSE